MNFATSEKYEAVGRKFWEAYQPIRFIYLPDESNKRSLKKRQERVCRYCGLTAANVSFNKEAHFFPESLGNKTLFSDYECDKCNELFGTYEDQLAKLVEVERPFNKVKGKRKFPGFTAPNDELKIRVKDFQANKIVQIERADVENDIMTFDEDSLTWKIKIKRNVIIPNKIYRYFVKLAISLITEQEVAVNYRYALDYIRNSPNIKFEHCRVTGYILPPTVNYIPHAYLFKKRSPDKKTFTHVMAFYFLNNIYSIPVPFNKTDFWFYNEQIEAINYPPFFIEGDDAVFCQPAPFFSDFSSEKAERPDDQEMFFQINKEQWKQRAAFDLEKNEYVDGADFNPKEIIKLIIMQGDDNSLSFPISNIDTE